MFRLACITTALLVPPVSHAGLITFQQGVSGYTGTKDTHTDSNSSGTNFNSSTLVIANVNPSDALLRFDDIFGAGASQIPFGSKIDSATLTLTIFDTGIADVRRMIADWNTATITHSNAMLNGNTMQGIQADGLEASTTPTLDDVLLNGTPVDVTSDLQAWSDGSANFGWAILDAGNDTRFRSSEFGTLGSRPLLTVNFSAIPEPSSAFCFLVGVACVSGMRRRRNRSQ